MPKLSQLPESGAITGSEIVPIVQGLVTRRIRVDDLLSGVQPQDIVVDGSTITGDGTVQNPLTIGVVALGVAMGLGGCARMEPTSFASASVSAQVAVLKQQMLTTIARQTVGRYMPDGDIARGFDQSFWYASAPVDVDFPAEGEVGDQFTPAFSPLYGIPDTTPYGSTGYFPSVSAGAYDPYGGGGYGQVPSSYYDVLNRTAEVRLNTTATADYQIGASFATPIAPSQSFVLAEPSSLAFVSIRMTEAVFNTGAPDLTAVVYAASGSNGTTAIPTGEPVLWSSTVIFGSNMYPPQDLIFYFALDVLPAGTYVVVFENSGTFGMPGDWYKLATAASSATNGNAAINIENVWTIPETGFSLAAKIAALPLSALDLRTRTLTTETAPTDMTVVFAIADLHDWPGTIDWGTNASIEASRDDGVTWTSAGADVVDLGTLFLDAPYHLYMAEIDVSAQPTGTHCIGRLTVDADQSVRVNSAILLDETY